MSEVKYISPRVSYRELPGEVTVVISATVSKSRQAALTVWLLLFGISGLLIISQIFVPGYTSYQRIGFFAFGSFWVYFIYKIGYAWFFRRKGMEFIRIQDGKMTIKRAVSTYGKSVEFLIGNIRDFSLREKNERSFSAELENSFWVLGGERLKFDYLGREIRLGIQLTEPEAKKLLQLFIRWLKNSKQST